MSDNSESSKFTRSGPITEREHTVKRSQTVGLPSSHQILISEKVTKLKKKSLKKNSSFGLKRVKPASPKKKRSSKKLGDYMYSGKTPSLRIRDGANVDDSFNGDAYEIIQRVLKSDNELIFDVLLTTYVSFTSAGFLMETVCSNFVDNDPKKIELIINFLLRWLSPIFWQDFKENKEVLGEKMHEFLNVSLKSIPISTKTAMLSSRLQHRFDENMVEGFIYDEPLCTISDPPTLYDGLLSHGSELRLKDIPVLELARQITLLESETFFNVPYKELLSVVWPKKFDTTSYKDDMVLFFNTTSTWVITEILKCKKLSNRIKTLAYFIELASSMNDLKNFNSLFSIISAIQSTPIIRLKNLFRGLSKRSLGLLEELKNLISHAKSFSAYRDTISAISPPFIPYIGLILGDLTFISEMPDTDNDNINFVKSSLVWNTISTIHRSRETRHNYYTVNSFKEYIKYSRNNFFSEDVQYKFSQYYSDSKNTEIPIEMILLQDINPEELPDYFHAVTDNQDIFSGFKSYLAKSFFDEELNLYRDLRNYQDSLYKSTIPEESMELIEKYLGYGKEKYKLSLLSNTDEIIENTIHNVLSVQEITRICDLERSSFDDLFKILEDFLHTEWLKFCDISKRKFAVSGKRNSDANMEDVMEDENLYLGFNDFLREIYSHEYLEFWKEVDSMKNTYDKEAVMIIADKWLGYPRMDPLISFSYDSSVSDVTKTLNSGEFDETVFDFLIDDCKEILLSKWTAFRDSLDKKKKKRKKGSLSTSRRIPQKN